MLHLHFRFPHIKWGLLHVFCRTARLYHLFSQKKVLLSVKVPRCAVPPDFLFCRTVLLPSARTELSPSARTEQFFEESCENGKAQRAHLMRRKTESSRAAAQSRGARGQQGRGRLHGAQRRAPTQGTHAGHPPCRAAQPAPRRSACRASAAATVQSSSRPSPRETRAAPSLTRMVALTSVALCQRTSAVITSAVTTRRRTAFLYPVSTKAQLSLKTNFTEINRK